MFKCFFHENSSRASLRDVTSSTWVTGQRLIVLPIDSLPSTFEGIVCKLTWSHQWKACLVDTVVTGLDAEWARVRTFGIVLRVLVCLLLFGISSKCCWYKTKLFSLWIGAERADFFFLFCLPNILRIHGLYACG